MRFTVSHRIPDFFTDHYPEPICEEGILLTDMIYLKQELPQVKSHSARILFRSRKTPDASEAVA